MFTPIHITTNKQQLQYIQKCISLAKEHCPQLVDDVDDLDNDLGEILFDMIEDTITEEYDPDTIHGFIY